MVTTVSISLLFPAGSNARLGGEIRGREKGSPPDTQELAVAGSAWGGVAVRREWTEAWGQPGGLLASDGDAWGGGP